MGSETTPPGQPEAVILAMPAEESWTPEQITWFRERLKAAMANPGPLRVLPSDHWKDRAEAAEAKLAAIEAHCRGCTECPACGRGETLVETASILAITGTEEEPRDA